MLIRHGSAEEGSAFKDDFYRMLDERGVAQVARLKELFALIGVPSPDVLFSSGFLRAEETFKGFGLDLQGRVKRDTSFAPLGAVHKSYQLILDEFRSLSSSGEKEMCIWVVGHCPHLNELLDMFLPHAASMVDGLEKSGLAWLSWDNSPHSDGAQCYMKCFLPRSKPKRFQGRKI